MTRMPAPNVSRYFGAKPSQSRSPVPASTSANSSSTTLRRSPRKSAMRRCWLMGGWCRVNCRPALIFLHPRIQQGQQYECEERRTQHAADDHGGERALHFRARAVRKRHREETECGHGGGHQHGTQPDQRPFADRGEEIAAFFAQLVETT